MKWDEIKKSNQPILDSSDVSCVQGAYYDDIRPNHTKKKQPKTKKKSTKNPQKTQHTWFLSIYGPDRNFFSPGFPQTKRCKNIEVSEFSIDHDLPKVYGKLPKIKVI